MARRPRADSPGSWHHVVNRAVAKRPYFETRSDKRYFLSRLALEVRAGRVELHAFCLMTTHFHLLVRSPIGEMSEGMRRLQCAYSRHFNRRRRRDGPLIRARFFSKPVRSNAYRRAVVRYIDANAVRARLVTTAAEHEFGSARTYLKRLRTPWLSREWVERYAVERSGSAEFDASAYLATFGPRDGEDLDSLTDLIELRMASTRELDPLDDLVGKTPPQVRRWMARKARLADGMEIGLPVCGPPAVHRALRSRLDVQGEWLVDRGSSTWRGSELARTGLLRDLCCLPIAQVASVCGASRWAIARHVEVHRHAILEDDDYARVVSEVANVALAATMPH